jgi:hypothetical protein
LVKVKNARYFKNSCSSPQNYLTTVQLQGYFVNRPIHQLAFSLLSYFLNSSYDGILWQAPYAHFSASVPFSLEEMLNLPTEHTQLAKCWDIIYETTS